MSLRNLLKIAFVGSLVYGAYKLGQSQGQKETSEEPEKDNDFTDKVDEVIEKNQSVMNEQIDYIRGIIQNLKNKPNKTSKDRDTIDLLNIKLDQLIKNK